MWASAQVWQEIDHGQIGFVSRSQPRQAPRGACLEMVPRCAMLLGLLAVVVTPFAPPARRVAGRVRSVGTTRLCAEEKKAAPRKGISPALKSKLLQEAATPWRTLRQFFYGAFALSASIGGLTAITQFAAAVAHQDGALPLSQTVTNIAVDFGVVAACAYGNSIDSRSAADVDVLASDDGAPPASSLADDVAAERLATLGALEVVVAAGDAERAASIKTLQRDAGQAVVVLGGAAAAVDDALLDALIQKAAFARAEVVVVPVRLTEDAAARPFDAPFVCAPADRDAAAWRSYVADEIATAEAQGADVAGGIVVALRRDGTVASRNIGKPPWPQLLASIDKKQKVLIDTDKKA